MFLIQYYTDAYKYQVETLYLFKVLIGLGFFSPKSEVFILFSYTLPLLHSFLGRL